jgi:hypothetical protein
MNNQFVGTVSERLWGLISFCAVSGVTYPAGRRRAASAAHLSTTQRLLDVPVESVQPGFSLAIHQDGDYPYTQIYLLQIVLNAHTRH